MHFGPSRSHRLVKPPYRKSRRFAHSFLEAFVNSSPHDRQMEDRQIEYESGSYQFVPLPVYRSGETVHETGIFTVVHPREAESKEVLIMRGTKLPYCSGCHHALAFCLEQEAGHISEDADFGRPKEIVSISSRRSHRRRKKDKQKASVKFTIHDF